MKWQVLLISLLAASLAGCTDDEPDEEPMVEETEAEIPAPIIVTAQIDAVGLYPVNPALSPASLTIVEGSLLQVTYTNTDINLLVTHDLYFSGVDEQTPALASGESAQLEFIVDLPPGEYPFWCAVGNHREQGMEGILTVVAADSMSGNSTA